MSEEERRESHLSADLEKIGSDVSSFREGTPLPPEISSVKSNRRTSSSSSHSNSDSSEEDLASQRRSIINSADSMDTEDLKGLLDSQLSTNKAGNNALDTILMILCDRIMQLETNVAKPAIMNRAVTDQAVQVMCTADDGCQTEIAWEFPAAHPVEVTKLYNRMTEMETKFKAFSSQIDARLTLVEKGQSVLDTRLQTIAHNIEGDESKEDEFQKTMKENLEKLKKEQLLEMEKTKEEQERIFREEKESLIQMIQSTNESNETDRKSSLDIHLEMRLQAEVKRDAIPTENRDRARARWRKAISAVLTAIKANRFGRMVSTKRLKKQDTVFKRLDGVESKLKRLLELTENIPCKEELGVSKKEVVDIMGEMFPHSLKSNDVITESQIEEKILLAKDDVTDNLTDKIYTVRKDIVSNLIDMRAKEATDIMMYNIFSAQDKNPEDADNHAHYSYQLQILLQHVIPILRDLTKKASIAGGNGMSDGDTTMHVQDYRTEEYQKNAENIENLRLKLETIDEMLVARLNEDSDIRSQFTTSEFENATRELHTCFEKCKQKDSQVSSLFQDTKINVLEEYRNDDASEKEGNNKEEESFVPTLSLLDILNIIQINCVHLSGSDRMNQIEALALSASGNATNLASSQELLHQVENQIQLVSSKFTTDIDALYRSVNTLEESAEETKAMQDLLRENLESSMRDKERIDGAVENMRSRSMSLRVLLETKVNEVSTSIDSKAGVNEIYDVKKNVKEALDSLTRIKEELPPEGFWDEMNEKITHKADKKVIHKLMKELQNGRKDKQTNVDCSGTLPAAGRIHLKCLSCEKPQLAGERAVSGGHCTPPRSPHKALSPKQQLRPQSAHPRIGVQGQAPIGSAVAYKIYSADTIHANRALNTKVFNQRLRELVTVEGLNQSAGDISRQVQHQEIHPQNIALPANVKNSNSHSGKLRGYKSSHLEKNDAILNDVKLQQEAVDYYKNVRSSAGFGESEFGRTKPKRPKSAFVRSDTNDYSPTNPGYSTVRPQLDIYATKKLPVRQYGRIKVPAKGYPLGNHFLHGAGNI